MGEDLLKAWKWVKNEIWVCNDKLRIYDGI